MGGALAGSESFGHSFDWRDDLGAYMVIIEKKSMDVVFQGTIPSMSTYHFAGAYEETAAVPAPARAADEVGDCLLYTSPSPRDQRGSRMPSSA